MSPQPAVGQNTGRGVSLPPEASLYHSSFGGPAGTASSGGPAGGMTQAQADAIAEVLRGAQERQAA